MLGEKFLSELHEAAIEYARSGFPVFICYPNSKTPATGDGLKRATTDIDVINAWFAERSDWNIATVPELSGLAVIEIERDGLSQLETFCNGHGPLPRTFTNRSPRGGEHRFYSGSVQSIVRPFEGFEIDTRGKGGYVLLPPSRTPDGEYVTIDDGDVADFPDWVAQRIAERKHDRQEAIANLEMDLPDNIRRGEIWLSTFAPPVQGERNHKTFHAACRLKDLGCSPQTILDMLLKWAPLSEDFTAEEVEGRVISAFENGQNAPGNDALTSSKDAFSNLNLANLPAKRETKSRFHMADEDEQDAEPAAEWLAPGVLPRRGTMCVYGASGAYKSFLLVSAALGVAAGKDVWGSPVTTPGTVIYGALEGRTALSHERRPAWRMANGVTGKLPFFVTRAPMIGAAGEMDEFIAEADKKHALKPIRLIVFETAAKMLVGCDATRDVPKLIAYCESLSERYDCMIIVSHHAGHDVERGPKDSSTYYQGFDNVIAVETPTRGSKISIATVTKFKDFPEPDQPFTFEGKAVAKSLVFQRTTAEQHRTLTKKEDAFAPPKVGGALKRLGAVGREKSVSTHILAAELIPPLETETTEDRDAALTAATRKLNKLSKAILEAYCTPQPSSKGGVQWHLP